MAEALSFRYPPVVLLFTESRPEGAKEFKAGRFGCVMWLLAAAAKGGSAAASSKTCGCPGGGVGLGFGNKYLEFPGGLECFYRFLSTGNEDWPPGRELAEKIKPFVRPEMFEHFLHGEGYMANPEGVKQFVECLPITEIPASYVLFKPLAALREDERPATVIFLADPDQLSALVILANYARGNNENVIIPYAAGCQTLGIYPYREARSPRPRAVVGLMDISARVEIYRLLGGSFLSFAAPWQLFLEMEENVAGSFLERRTWRTLLELKESKSGKD